MIHLSAATPPRKAYQPQKPKAKPRPLTPMQLAAKALNLEQRNRPAKEPAAPTAKFDWSPYPLGEMPDTEIAKLAGKSHQAVARARKKLGIAAHQRGSK